MLELDPGQKSVSLPLTTIDRIVEELHLERVDFIKMDIKGAEVEALKGAGGVLRSFRPRLAVASEHLPDDPEAIPATVRNANGAYRVQCGVCSVEGGSTRPEVLHFF